MNDFPKQHDDLGELPDEDMTAPEDGSAMLFTVEENEALERLDRFLSARLDGQMSREKIKKAILEGQVSIGHESGELQVCTSPKRTVLAGEAVSMELPQTGSGVAAEDGDLNILYADDDIVVLNKPHNLSAHPSPGEEAGTLVNRLLHRFPVLRQMEGERPGIVHRLDKDTTGLMLVALNEPTRLALIDDFSNRNVGKEYLALVYGVPMHKQGRIEEPIGRDPRNKTRMAVYRRSAKTGVRRGGEVGEHVVGGGGREARSDYRTLYADPRGRFSLLAVTIHTGRTHQIRVHLTHIGHPIIGDKVYTDEAAVKKAISPKELSEAQREFLAGLTDHQLLHAWRLHFEHPSFAGAEGSEDEEGYQSPAEQEAGSAGRMEFCAGPPPEFIETAVALSASLQRVVLTGNPACGKSSVLKLLAGRGVPISWSADVAVAAQYKVGSDGWTLLKAHFGNQFIPVGEDGREQDVDKRALFKAMCEERPLRRMIEQIIHPIVMAEMLHFWEWQDTLPLYSFAPLAVAEVPLYLESSARTGLIPAGGAEPGFAPSRPLVIGIHCPFEQRAVRMRETRNWPDEMIQQIESWQWPEDSKMAACDLIIDNTGSLEELAASVDETLKQLERLREQRVIKLRKILDDLTACIN